MRSHRILMVTTVASTLRAFLLPFATHYRGLGWQVDALASGVSDCPECSRAFDQVFEAGWGRNPLSLLENIGAARTVSAVTANGRYDMVHVHTPVAAMVARAALRLRDRSPRMIYTAHGFHFFQGGAAVRNAAFIALEKLAGCWTDALVVINREDEASARRLALVSQQRIVYMPGIGIDLSRYNAESVSKTSSSELRAALNLGEGTSVFLQIADFVPRKRHRDLLRAFAMLPPSTRLLLAGDGPELGAMVLLARDLGIVDRVRFLGQRNDVPVLLALADAVLLVSEQEGLPRCVLEAMAMERPVVGTRVRGTKDLLEQGGGILVPVGNVDAIAAGMRDILERPVEARAMGLRGRESVTKYDQQLILELHDRLYEQILQ
jgi:glycosyltransferase involved in cell wall biosynthesis